MEDGLAPRRRLLIVDDEAGNRRLIARVFRRQFDIVEAENGDEALERARRLQPHVIITDQRMPGMSGVELLARLKEELPETIRILVTAHADYGSLVDAVNAAQIHHYVEKPFHTIDVRTVVDALSHSQELESERADLLVELQAAVQRLQQANARLTEQEAHLQRLVEARTEELAEANRKLERANRDLQDTNRSLEELAVRDGLTGAYNHRYLHEHLKVELARSRRYHREFSILFIDIDDFKQINDTCGHPVGDDVLRRLAELLHPAHSGMRRSDIAARYGGEEFVMVLPETGAAGATTKAERVRGTTEDVDWRAVEGLTRGVTVSIGVASYPDHGSDVETLIRAADTALYEAKRSGKNRVVVAPPRADAGHQD